VCLAGWTLSIYTADHTYICIVEGVYERPRSECLVVPGRIRVHEFATPVDQ
jgi:hypothetical protein